MCLGTSLRAQREEAKSPLVDSFFKVIDLIPTGYSLSEVLTHFNPVDIVRRKIAQRYAQEGSNIYGRRLDGEIVKAITTAAKSRARSQTALDLALQNKQYGSKANFTNLVRQLKTFLFAGHDTSAAAISWVYYYLSCHPEVLKKLRAEHDAVFGPFTDTPTLANKLSSEPKLLAKLDYTVAVIREALRLRPVADGAREGYPGYIIRTASGREFDAGATMISPQHLALHTDPAVWGPSAFEFDPDRFMNGKVPMAYMPFATRPRDCIGRNLVYLEV